MPDKLGIFLKKIEFLEVPLTIDWKPLQQKITGSQMHGFLTQTINYAGHRRNRLNTPEVKEDLKNQKKSAVLKEGFYLTMIGVFVSSKLYFGSKNPNLDNRTLIPVAIFLSLYVLMCLYRAQNVIGAVNNPKLSRLDDSVRVLTNCREQLESFPTNKPHRL